LFLIGNQGVAQCCGTAVTEEFLATIGHTVKAYRLAGGPHNMTEKTTNPLK
jgi:hypothetical protein